MTPTEPTDDEKIVPFRQRERIARALGESAPAEPSAVDSGGGGPHPPDMELAERIARVEAAIDGLRHSQNLTIGATVGVGGILAAFIIGFGIYTLQRIDQTQDVIAREAAATRQELVGVTTAIASSITAARQMQPQIVVMPPGIQVPPSPPKPPK